MNFKVPYLTREQRESDGVKSNDFEERYLLSDCTHEFNNIELKEDILIFKDRLRHYGISFRDLLTYAPKHKDSRIMCIKIAKVLAKDENLFKKMEKTKTLPIQELLRVVNVYRGTLDKNRKFIIALSLIMTSDLEVLNGYISQPEVGWYNLGTVIELAQDGAIVMVSDCDFVLIKKQKGMFLGQQVKFTDAVIKNPSKVNIKIISAITSIAVVLMVILIAVLHFGRTSSIDRTYAFVDIDINPSLELLVDRKNIVVGINAINKDAEILLADNDLKGLTVDDAIDKVYEFAYDRGFVYADKENLILISLALNPDAKKKGDEEQKLEALLSKIELKSSGNNVIRPVVITVPDEIKKTADQNNISTGRQYIYEKSKEQVDGIDLAKAKKSSIEDLLNEVKNDFSFMP